MNFGKWALGLQECAAFPTRTSEKALSGRGTRLNLASIRPEILDFERIEARLRGKWRPLQSAGAEFQTSKVLQMAKAVTIKVKLVSSADTGFYYVAKKNSRTMTEKLVKKKYDPVARKHVEFREAKIK